MRSETQTSTFVAILGHVDHGKSTFLGHFLHLLGALQKGKLERVRELCKKQQRDFEFAFLLDAFEEEQRQGITLDISQAPLKIADREFTLIDIPGHEEFLKKMVTGASRADAAVILIDASQGIREQSLRHARLLSLLNVKQLIVLCNKMDLCSYSKETFEKIRNEYSKFLSEVELQAREFIPVVAKDGDLLTSRSDKMNWYKGPTVSEAFSKFHPSPLSENAPLRFPLQDVYKWNEQRLIVGRIESGSLKVGDTIVIWPTHSKAKIRSLETWPEHSEKKEAHAGESITLTLDRELFVDRGQIISHEKNPPEIKTRVRASVFWMGKTPLRSGEKFTLKLLTQEVECAIENGSPEISPNSAANVTISCRKPIIFDITEKIQSTSRFVVVRDSLILGGGIILEALPDQTRRATVIQPSGKFDYSIRRDRFRNEKAILWLTGMSGAGKTSISVELEKRLAERGALTYHLDGDVLRQGLCADLDFSEKSRNENIRRAGEVAALFADAGSIVMASFISPYRQDRKLARQAAREIRFVEVFVDCPLEICEKRDPKNLYRKARSGQIIDFTGISTPYEEPIGPELHLRTHEQSLEECVNQILKFLETQKIIF